ncbi:hypothetical protein AGMMS50262_01810 [Bacteroidia bacterium]|nr:hypothetical protein AGMMS50262_01810 [Bacteroidia bacterium]
MDFPALPARAGWLYYFEGSRADSLPVLLDGQGRGRISLPVEDYKGMAYLHLQDAGGAEFVLAEDVVKMGTVESQFNTQALRFDHSKENERIAYLFGRRGNLLQTLEWINSGLENDELQITNYKLRGALQSEKIAVERALRAFDDSLSTSPFYADRFMELNLFMGEIYGAIQQPDTAKLPALRAKIAGGWNAEALYRSGQLWNEMARYYPDILAARNTPVSSTAPALTGLDNDETTYGKPAIVIFYDEDCSHCREEIAALVKQYDVLKDTYRIISVSSDTNIERFRVFAPLYPWPDQLCDGQGDEGINFRNYSVVATPTIFVIDAAGKIQSRSNKLTINQ